MSRSRRMVITCVTMFCFVVAEEAICDDMSDLLQRVDLSDQTVSNVEATYHVDWVQPSVLTGKADSIGEYGFANGKVFLRKRDYAWNDGTSDWRLHASEKPISTFISTYAFDGKILRTMDESPKAPYPSGYVAPLTTEIARSCSPHTLLGRSLIPEAANSFSAAIRQSELVAVDPTDKSQGRNTIRIDVEVPLSVIGEPTVHAKARARVWLDPERDLRVIRIEQYDRQTNDKSHLRYVLENVELIQIEGVWMPIRADQTWYDASQLDPHGNPIAESTQRITIAEWRFPSAIDASKFTIDYRDGVHVYDQISGTKFTAGHPDTVKALRSSSASAN